MFREQFPPQLVNLGGRPFFCADFPRGLKNHYSFCLLLVAHALVLLVLCGLLTRGRFLLCRRRRRRVCRQALQQSMIPVYVLVVLRKCRRKEVSALRVRHEVKIVRLRGLQSGAQGDLPRIPDWPWRQTTMHVSVVR